MNDAWPSVAIDTRSTNDSEALRHDRHTLQANRGLYSHLRRHLRRYSDDPNLQHAQLRYQVDCKFSVELDYGISISDSGPRIVQGGCGH